jgi:vacuolar-type H+-ATPase subunit E/Vma4
MDGVITVSNGKSTKNGRKNPTLKELIQAATKDDKGCNISIYDGEMDEYYPVQIILRATDDNDVLDEGHLILGINIPNME